jgi:6-phosphogluconolactonase (cycloisomerase 2 family)
MIMKKLFFNSLFYLFVSVFFILLTGCYGDASGSSSGSSSDPVVKNKYVYSVSYESHAIYTYSIEESGTLSPIGNALPLSLPLGKPLSPVWIMVTPYNAYVVSQNRDDSNAGYLSSYNRNPNTGVLTECVNHPLPTGDTPFMGVVTPSGQYVYVLNEGGLKVAQYQVNACDLNRIQPDINLFMTPDSMLVDPSGKYVYITGTNPQKILAYHISNTGVLEQQFETSLGYDPLDIAIAPSGHYAYVTSQDNKVYQYDMNPNTGEIGLSVESFPTEGTPIGLVLSPSGKNAYVANFESNTISQYSIDTNNGQLATITGASPTVISESGPYSITVTPSGKYLYVTNQRNSLISMYSIESVSGALSSTPATIHTGDSPYGIFAW